MAIQKRLTRFNLGVISEDFTTPYHQLAKSIYVTESEVLSAAVTVGHKNPDHWKLYLKDKYAKDDILSRIHFVRAFLDFSQGGSIHHTELFSQSDPTEKAFINYRLGMLFMKLVAHKLLNIPWLVHYSWLHHNGEVAVATKSSPDLLGYDALNSEWSSIEAKGRSRGLSNSVLVTAKTQAQQVTHINTIQVSRHIGGGIYRKGKSRLAFKWRDPEPEGEVKLTINGTAFKNYYAGIFRLYDLQDDPELRAAFGSYVRLSPSLLDLKDLLQSPRELNFDQSVKFLKMIQSEAVERRAKAEFTEKGKQDDMPIENVQDDGVIILGAE